ncbi:MAG: hypothetical protein KY396_02125 [Actinobacteria bacterium]|nr:hypothetical protein [Actinomycetota bacterium]
MEISISDMNRATDLIAYLRGAGYDAARVAPDRVAVSSPRGRTVREARVEVGVYVTAWRALNPDVKAELIAAMA